MKFAETKIPGVWELSIEPRGDERGFFARVACRHELAHHGLEPHIEQVNSSMSVEPHTLRGMHYQVAPYGETKLVRCIKGSIFDVVLDLRENSPTFGQWHGAHLSQDNRQMLYIPKGCAHGFMTLEPNSEIIYFVSAGYEAQAERIVRWDDPQFQIVWPCPPAVLSDKDKHAPDFDPATHNTGYS